MPQHHSNPDLEDSINVTEAHERLVREAAAAAREKRIAADGREPASLWIVVTCAVALLIAGGILGGAGKLFAYDNTFRQGYVRVSAEGAGDSGPLPKAALDAYMARGQRIYSVKCNGCHLADAKGDGANYPSLVGSKWVLGDTQTLAMIILNGLQGPTSTGKTYGAGIMVSQRQGLSPEDLAGVMTYVRNHFGNSNGDVVTTEMAKAAFEIADQRPNPNDPVTAAEIAAAHATALPGTALAPDTMVNPITLLPVEAAPADAP
jgi:mono/diheme cytochrome c family protein